MPAPRKFSYEITQQILKDFHSDMNGGQVGKKYGCGYFSTIRKVWLTRYTLRDIDARFKRLCALHKVGKKNPMWGKYRSKHPRHNPEQYTIGGYRAVVAPRWYTGPTFKAGFAFEHILVACCAARIRQLPELHVVHHKDGNKLNNHPSNLEILSRHAHMMTHAWERRRKKAQRLSREGVQDKSSGSASISDG